MDMALEAHSLVEIKREPVDNLAVVIKTEPEWIPEESSTGLLECTSSASPDILQEEAQVYPLVKLEPAENATEACENCKSETHLDPLDTICSTGIKSEVTEQLLKKKELVDCSDCSNPLQELGEEEWEKIPDDDTKKNVLANLVPFLKQELDCNLHSIREERPSSEAVDGSSDSVPEVDDDDVDNYDDSPESPRLVIAEVEDTSSVTAVDELSEPCDMLGDGWRITVFRCGHCMALAWDVVRLARHDCILPQQRKLNGSILGRLRPGTQVRYVNLFGCHVCGKLFFKRKNYRKHVSTFHSEALLKPFFKPKVCSDGDSCNRSASVVSSSDSDAKLALVGDVTVSATAVSGTKSTRHENGDNLELCVVCRKESCQMHKYVLLRGKCDSTKKVPVFICHKCKRDFRCEDNYWRHMYYHGFKMEVVSEEEPTAVLHAVSHVDSKKKIRRPRKKTCSSLVEPSVDLSHENTVPQSAPQPLSDVCSLKSASQGEGTGGVSVAASTAKICFATVGACEIRNRPSIENRSASKSNKRKISEVSFITEEDGPHPKKNFSPADDKGTVDVLTGCSSAQIASRPFRPETSVAKDSCGTVSSEERERVCAMEGEMSDLTIDSVWSARLEKNEWNTIGALNEEGEEVTTEKLPEEYNGPCSTVSDNFSTVTSRGDMSNSSSLQLRKRMNQIAVEVIDDEDDNINGNCKAVEVIDLDDDDDDDDEVDVNINSNGRADKISSFPDTIETEEKCDGKIVAVSGQENLERGSDYSSCTLVQGLCNPGETYSTSQNMEIDFNAREQEAVSADRTATGKRSLSTAGKVTVGDSQSTGTPFVQAGVNLGARVAVIKCANGNESRLVHEKLAPNGCEGRTGVRILQVSNTAVYRTVPVRQVTKLAFLPAVRHSANSDGTVGYLRKLSNISLKVSGTPRIGSCLLKCEKCNLLGMYSPTFFSHKCSPPNSSANDSSGVLSADSVRMVPNHNARVIPGSSRVCAYRGIVANRKLTGSVLWKCLRCNFTTYRCDVFKSHLCNSPVHFKILLDGQAPGALTRCDEDVSPDAGKRRDAEVVLGAGTRSDSDIALGTGMRSDANTVPPAGTRNDADVTPGAGIRSDADVVPGAGTRQDTDVVPGAGTRSDTGVAPGAGAKCDADVVAGAGMRCDADVESGARTRCDADVVPDAGTRCDADVVPGPGTRCDADVAPGPGTRCDADVAPGPGTRCDADVAPGPGTRCDADVAPGAGTRCDADVAPGAGTRCDPDVAPGARRRCSADIAPGIGMRRNADVAPGVGTGRDTDVVPTPPVEYLWKCVGCGLYSNSRQCLLMHKCSSFKRKVTGSDAVFTGPELMCCKCGFKTAGRLMFATHRCASLVLPPWLPRDKVPAKWTGRGAPDSTSPKKT
ncbi:uncharacterized protein LOC126293596 isoform X2 [Schistocerca gregaria]|uniref:uncharacterized protein LOC126293596 isoform X2 n=1 Tax=Schistocerca gregaria TaxID=7010 RepID=UPI00211F2841|nr:uncharacterized protein LOC126293596 isoform X2 [Schistocerca gregaria]